MERFRFRVLCLGSVAFVLVGGLDRGAVQEKPALSLDPTSVAFNVQPGFESQPGNVPPIQIVKVTSTGAPLTYSVSVSTSSGSDWLYAGPVLAGATPSSLVISLNPSPIVGPTNSSNLPAGTYYGAVTFTSDGASNHGLKL